MRRKIKKTNRSLRPRVQQTGQAGPEIRYGVVRRPGAAVVGTPGDAAILENLIHHAAEPGAGNGHLPSGADFHIICMGGNLIVDDHVFQRTGSLVEKSRREFDDITGIDSGRHAIWQVILSASGSKSGSGSMVPFVFK